MGKCHSGRDHGFRVEGDRVMTSKDQLQGMAALHCTLAKMDGHDVDKKAARYSAMADYMMLVGGMSQPFSEQNARAALDDAVLSAVRGDPMHMEGQPLCMSPYGWMLAPQKHMI